MAIKSPSQMDPRERHQKPPFEEPRQAQLGNQTEMRTKPDHGEGRRARFFRSR